VLTKTLITIGIFLSLFSYASAQTANSYPVSWQRPGDASQDYSWGFGASDREIFFVHVATSSIAGATIVAPDLCYTTANTGTLEIEVWLNGTTTGTLVASSTIQKSVLPLCITSGTAVLGSSTPFLLNRSFNATAGQSLYIRIRQNGGSGSYYVTGDLTASASHFILYANGGPYVYTGKLTDSFVKIGSGLQPYSTAWSDLVAGAKSNECDGIIECAVAWAFWPDPLAVEQFKSINLASTSPIGYIYDMDDAMQTFLTAISATTSSFKITLDMTTLGNTSNVFSSVSSSSVVVFDVCWVNRPLGELPANTYRDRVLPVIVFCMWIGLGWLAFSTGMKIW